MSVNATIQNRNNKKSNSSHEDCMDIVLFLAQNHKNGVLNRGAMKEAEKHFLLKKPKFENFGGNQDQVFLTRL